MYKRIAVIILIVSLFWLVWEGVMSLQESESRVPSVEAVKKTAAPGGTQKQVSFYPQVPKKLPDLNQGYVFNEDRFLASADTEEKGEQAEEPTDGVKLDMDQLFYAGSIIIGDNRKGLVSYVDLQAKSVKKKKATSKTKKSSSSKKKYAQLKINDQLGGYTVTEVEADHITFERGGKSIAKTLHDSSKVRIKPAARKKVVSRKRTSTSSRKKVSLGTPGAKSRTVTSKSVRTPKVVQSKRVRTPAGTTTRNIQPPVSR
jgi:hypothetical protein